MVSALGLSGPASAAALGIGFATVPRLRAIWSDGTPGSHFTRCRRRGARGGVVKIGQDLAVNLVAHDFFKRPHHGCIFRCDDGEGIAAAFGADRKSTRLNS